MQTQNSLNHVDYAIAAGVYPYLRATLQQVWSKPVGCGTGHATRLKISPQVASCFSDSREAPNTNSTGHILKSLFVQLNSLVNHQGKPNQGPLAPVGIYYYEIQY